MRNLSSAPAEASPIAGVWSLISETMEALIVATATYASVIFVEKARQRFQADKPTQAEEADAYRSMLAQAGPYSVAGSRLTHHRQFTRNPNVMGSDEHFEFSIEHGVMKMHSIDANGRSGPAMTWQKIE